MYYITHIHSVNRWLVLTFLILSILIAFIKWKKELGFTQLDKIIGMITISVVHTQLMLGLYLYVVSPKVQYVKEMMGNDVLRFYTIEHIFGMLVSITLISIGYSKAKREKDHTLKFKAIFKWYITGIFIILVTIPWPFLKHGGAWY